MPSVKGFAGGQSAVRYSGFAVPVIAAINIAATPAATKQGESNAELRTSVIGELLMGGLTNGAASGPIGNGWLHFPLWIKVPPSSLPLTKSPRRFFSRRLLPEMAANKQTKPEGFMIPECRTAAFAAGQAGLWILFIYGGDSHD
jgi:hypothetical protein